MFDFLSPIINIDSLILSPASPNSIGEAINAMGLSLSSATWPTANKAIYVPFSLSEPFPVAKIFVINGTAVSGNIDVGVVDRGGSRRVAIGSTAQSGTTAVQEFDVTDTTLNPGEYFFTVAMDNTTGQLESWNPNSAICRALGLREQTSAFPIPSSATFAAISSSRIPFIGLTPRTVV
jgi:hypothetical protein